ncbi:MAG: VPLPA-CTERM sorting domain-containing protein [Roseibium sp.]|uniref:VPLPA-CTERM sorting domain-containing protein n=1 Tax=Roseibium sp. TaxID=1936156 RepID=UPI003D9C362A
MLPKVFKSLLTTQKDLHKFTKPVFIALTIYLFLLWGELKMRTLFRPILLAGALSLSSAGALAAPSVTTYTQYTLGSTCSFNSAGTGGVSSSCGNYGAGDGIDARASFGDIGIRTKAAGPSASLDSTIPENNDFWRGGAAMNDTLSFSIDSGTFRLFTDIAVDIIETVTGSFGGSSFPAGRNVFSVRVQNDIVYQSRHEYQNGSNGQAALLFTDDFGSTGTGFVDIGFTGGSLDLHVSLYSEATCGSMHTGNFFNKTGSCLLGADAFNSLRLIGSTVFDTNGGELANGYQGSQSGFDYTVGVAQHDTDTTTVVPLPASLPLLATGLAAMALVRRKKRQAH